MRGASIVLIVYSLSMVFYGSVEMGHDLLHYLGELQIWSIHDHDHDHHHSMHDHDHGHSHSHDTLSHHHASDQEEDESLPSLINFFLFTQAKPVFRFFNSLLTTIPDGFAFRITVFEQLPPTPPPESELVIA